MKSLHIIFSSISGHTEYVVQILKAFLLGRKPELSITLIRAEQAKAEDLLQGDMTILACGTWNTTGQEGQLSPYMHEFINTIAKDVDLSNRLIAFISLGDERYFYTCRCTEHFLAFQRDHKAHMLLPPLVIANEPYDQSERILAWGEKLLAAMEKQAVVA